MNKSYIEWIDYYENATKEDVIQDMMLDINSIKEKDKEIERLNNIINELEKFFKYEFDNEVRPLGSYKVSVWTICLDKLKELKEGKK